MTYPCGRQDVGIWEGNRLIRCCTSQCFLQSMPPIGRRLIETKVLEYKEPRNIPLEILRNHGGHGFEDFFGNLACPWVHHPVTLRLTHKLLRLIYGKGEPWGPQMKQET